MKKPYQIESQRAVKQLEQMAEDGNLAVQMVLPMAEMVGWLRKGVGELIRQAGLQLIGLLMEEEVRLGSYELFHRGEPLTETVWEKLMLGLSTRNYGRAVREFTEAYGLEKSAVSEHFIEASRTKLKDMMES